jgi:uncharacterized membrane protein
MEWRDALEFWRWSNTSLGAFHLWVAVAALAIGPLVFFRRKGDIAHRLLGFAYVVAMATTNLSALSLYEFTGGPNYFHLFAIFSLLTVSVGVIGIIFYAVKKSPLALDLHLQMMSWSYFGLVLAAIAEAGTRGLPRLFDGADNFWTPFFIFLSVFGAIGGVFTAALIRPVRKRWLQKP